MTDKSNHLVHEKSPYLLQHAHNPVRWYAWGADAFKQAKLEDKPILLSIGYSTCHWCHVMAHESFEDEGIAKIINANYVPIKVDREERPDIDHIYMTATTAMSGQGGWPLTVFLTSEGKPFYGGTYFPPYAKWGSPGFVDVLTNIAQAWGNNRSEILASSESITQMLMDRAGSQPVAKASSADYSTLAYRQMLGHFDEVNGGFGTSPKFPMAHQLMFLLRFYKKNGEVKALAMVEQTLKAMARGGIHDHLGGGFHRYSTDQQWHVPHFEKMLYDQALVSHAYLEAFQATQDSCYAQVAHGIFQYVLKDLTDATGAFLSAEDADSISEGASHATEGAFYIFSFEEIVACLGVDKAQVFNFFYGVERNGNASFDPHGEFVGRNILFQAHELQATGEQFKLSVLEVEAILKEGRQLLLDLRNSRTRPHLDDKVLVDWNGLMIASLALGGSVLGEDKYIQAAKVAADFILAKMYRSKRLLHRWREGDAAIDASLEDYAFLTWGLLALYESTFEEKYLVYAQELTLTMIELFEDKQGGFFMTPKDGEALIFRPKDVYDGAIPSGNSVAALNLLRLYALTGKEQYQRSAQLLIENFSAIVENSPSAYAFFLMAQDFNVNGPTMITCQGVPQDPAFVKLLQVINKHFILYRVIYRREGQEASANICYKGMCLLPISDAGVLAQRLLE